MSVTTCLAEYDAVADDLVRLVRMELDGQPGVAEAARHLMCDGDDCLSGRMFHLRQRIAAMEAAARKKTRAA